MKPRATTVVFQEATLEGVHPCDTPIDREALPGSVLVLLDNWNMTTNGLLQCASEDDMSRVHQLSDEQVSALDGYLDKYDLRLREDDEPLLRRAEELYGHVRRVPVEILVLQLDELSLFGPVTVRPQGVVRKMQEHGIHTLGQFEGRPAHFLGTFFRPADTPQVVATAWLEGMLQMAGIRLLPR